MNSGSKRRKKTTTKKQQPKPTPKPKIPSKILDAFLQDKINIKELPNVTNIEQKYLWEKGDIIRYRINVWVEERMEGRYCPKVYIQHSFFLHYRKGTQSIEDKTIEQTIDIETMRKMPF